MQWPGVLSDPQILHAVEPGQPLDQQRDALALYNKLIARKNCTDAESQEQVQRVLSMFQISAHVKEAKAIIPQDIKYEALQTWMDHVRQLWSLDRTKTCADQSGSGSLRATRFKTIGSGSFRATRFKASGCGSFRAKRFKISAEGSA